MQLGAGPLDGTVSVGDDPGVGLQGLLALLGGVGGDRHGRGQIRIRMVGRGVGRALVRGGSVHGTDRLSVADSTRVSTQGSTVTQVGPRRAVVERLLTFGFRRPRPGPAALLREGAEQDRVGPGDEGAHPGDLRGRRLDVVVRVEVRRPRQPQVRAGRVAEDPGRRQPMLSP
ncbi:hypothetical protein GCM10009678_04600 [Actinomadura kijaniata]